MHLHVGRCLDGFTPRLAVGAATAGEAWVGRLGLVSRLETRLGLGGLEVPDPVRIEAYRARAEQVAGGAFFASSWAVDAFGTARELLRWRDELVLGGWDGASVPQGGERLEALAHIEAVVEPTLPVGHADRVRRLVSALGSLPEAPGIARVVLHDPRELLPVDVQRLVSQLERLGVAVEAVPLPPPRAPAGSDLGRLQRAVLAGGGGAAALRGDGSLLYRTGRTPWEAADGLAALLATEPAGAWPTDTAVVRTGSTLVLDQALRRHGIATLGSSSETEWRPAQQVLPLLLSLLWRPRNPARMLELLTLPVSPLPRALRERLAEALAGEPGIGGPRWLAAIEQAAERSREPDAVCVAVEAWLSFPEFDEQGASLEAVRAIAERVAQWALRRARGADAVETPALATAAAQASQLRALLGERGGVSIGRQALEQLFQSITRGGSSRPVHEQKSGSFVALDAPGAAVQPFDTVVWWGAVRSAADSPPRLPWRSSERAALAAAGVALESPRTWARAVEAAWLRPVLNATRRLVLVGFDSQAGNPEAAHPVWEEIRGRMGISDADLPRVARAWHDLLADTSFGAAGVVTAPGAGERPKPLAKVHVAGTLLRPRELESATSLEALLGCPLRWALKHRAYLQPGGIPALSDGKLLYGNVSHRLLGSYLAGRKDALPAPELARAEVLARFDAGLEQSAATLLRPERREELERVRGEIGRAAEVLVGHLHAGGYRVVGTELPIDGASLGGQPVRGAVDLLLAHEQRGLVVVDLKWSGSSYRAGLLEKGLALQLALYVGAVGQRYGRVGGAAYFIVSEARMLALDPALFPGAAVVRGPPLDQTLAALERTLTTVRARLEEGTLLAPALLPGDDPSRLAHAALPLSLEPPCGFCDYPRVCGVSLGVTP